MVKNKIKTVACLLLTLFVLGGCKKTFNQPQSNPEAVFNELWGFMDKHYPMFAIKEIDWDKTYAQYKNRVKPGMVDAELFSLLNQLLFTLKDGHVTLMSATDTATYLGFYKNYPLNFNLANIKNNYLFNDFKKAGPVMYKIVSNVAYIYYASFAQNISDAELDIFFNDIKATKGLIIDVRNNTGGNPANAEKFFSRLINQKTLVKYEVIKNGPGRNDFFEPKPFYISPNGQTYAKPIILLTNRLCFSTCNDFALYISLLPNAQIMGNPTGGGAGLPYNYILANGWKLQYSATYTLSPKMRNIENGIQPNRTINFEPQDENNGKDIILETAFNTLSLE